MRYKVDGILRSAKLPLVTILLSTIMLLLCACSSDTPPSDMSLQEEDKVAVSVAYPVNESGQTYGSSADAYQNLPEGLTQDEVREYLPDLVLVVNDSGIEGYVSKDDFLPKMPSTPEEVASLSETSSTSGHEVTMYASDGKTVLGVWEAPTIGVEPQ